MNTQQAYDMARALEGVSVRDHFGSDAFTANKRIFLSVSLEKKTAVIRFSADDQREFLSRDGEAFTEIDNHWGKQGWTKIHFEYIEQDEFEEALKAAYEFSATKIPAGKTQKKKKSKKKVTATAAKKRASLASKKSALKKISRKKSAKRANSGTTPARPLRS